MDENRNDYEEQKKNPKDCSCHWIKFAVLLFSLFLACYLATYYILDQVRHAYYIPSVPIENIDKIIQEQDKLFNEDFGVLPMHNKALRMVKIPVETYRDSEQNAFKIIIDLKQFDKNPKNISVDVQDNRVSVTGISEKFKNNKEKVYTFTQSFVLPENIDTKNVTREVSGNKYIVTLPILNPLVEEDDD